MTTRAAIDLASLRRLHAQREALRGVDHFSYSEDLRSVMVSPVLTCPPEAALKSAVTAMAERRTSSVVVVGDGGQPLGIVTDHDVLRIVASDRLDIAEVPVSRVMTGGLLTLSPDDTVYRALFLQSSKGVKHLPLVEDGRLVGIVTLRQLLKLRYPEPMTLISGIAGARDVEALRRIKQRLPRLAASRLSRGSRAYDVVVMLSLINQDLHRRAFELVCAQAGEPPGGCCLFVTGSHGRLETLLTTDQDHALILADGADEEAVDRYWAGVAETFVSWLEEIGFARCDGDVMSTNPLWRKSLAGWKAQLDHWVVRQVPHLGRYVTLFFDARPIHGDQALFRELGDHAFDLLGRHHEVLRILHEEASGHRVPTGFWGRFITERSGEHRGALDLKRSGLIFVVEGVRILALSHGVRETATLRRISRLVDGGHLHSDDGEYFEGAYRFLLHFALDAQVEKAMKDEEIDTYVNPSLLSQRNRQMLRHAYKAVSSLQDLIASELGHLAI